LQAAHGRRITGWRRKIPTFIHSIFGRRMRVQPELGPFYAMNITLPMTRRRSARVFEETIF
jgi:hypothetical protein